MYRRRVHRAILGIPLVLSGIGMMVHLGFMTTGNKWSPASSIQSNGSKRLHQGELVHDSQWGVAGVQQMRFRDNLLANTSYITSWGSGGMTNQFISHVSADGFTVLGAIFIITDRSHRYEIKPYTPAISECLQVRHAEVFPFSDVFDLAYLRNHLRRPVLDWKNVKHIHSSGLSVVQEDLGCWTAAEEIQTGPRRVVRIEEHLGLDVSYLQLPLEMRRQSDAPASEIHVVFSHLAALIYPQQLNLPAKGNKKIDSYGSPKGYNHTTDTCLVCFDSLYYATSGVKPFEWQYTWSPAWRFAGRHLPFTRSIQKLAKEYILRSFGLTGQGSDMVLPTFIAVHVRRSDFLWACEPVLGKARCSAPLSVYGHYVAEIKKECQERLNITISHILGVSDDESEDSAARVRSEGWFHVNHTKERTTELYGRWYPSLLDTAMLSMATGLVGTKDYTVSLVAGKRVQDWNNGAFREVDIWSDWSALAAKQP